MTASAISIVDLEKTYAGGKRALEGVSLEVPQGQIFGLLGPNGAGKSTLINILAGLVTKTGGKAVIWGFDIDRHPRNAKRSIGVVPQEIIFDPFFTPRETLEIQAGLYGIAPADRKTDELLAAMHLSDKANAYSRTLSGGMKRRLLVAKAMVHSPPILVLDEPTAGVDVELRQDMWQVVRDLRASGVTIILTTHYIEEAEDMANRIGVISEGEIILVENKTELMHKLGKKQLTLQLHQQIEKLPPELAKHHLAIEADGHELVYTYDSQGERTGITGLLQDLTQAGVRFKDLQTTQSSLEDIFVDLVRQQK